MGRKSVSSQPVLEIFKYPYEQEPSLVIRLSKLISIKGGREFHKRVPQRSASDWEVRMRSGQMA